VAVKLTVEQRARLEANSNLAYHQPRRSRNVHIGRSDRTDGGSWRTLCNEHATLYWYPAPPHWGANFCELCLQREGEDKMAGHSSEDGLRALDDKERADNEMAGAGPVAEIAATLPPQTKEHVYTQRDRVLTVIESLFHGATITFNGQSLRLATVTEHQGLRDVLALVHADGDKIGQAAECDLNTLMFGACTLSGEYVTGLKITVIAQQARTGGHPFSAFPKSAY
jgi:hypothetical protein